MIKIFSNDDYQQEWFKQIVSFINHKRIMFPNHIWAGYREWDYATILHHSGLFSGSTQNVLDTGCGWSIFPLLLKMLGHNVTTIDFNFAGRLNQRQNEYGLDIQNYDGDLADSRFMAFFKQQFDVITCISVLEHINDGELVLHNLGDCLKPGAKIAITVDFHDSPIQMSETDDPIYEMQNSKYSPYGTLITEKSLCSLVTNAGLKFVNELNNFLIKDYVSFYTLAFALLEKRGAY